MTWWWIVMLIGPDWSDEEFSAAGRMWTLSVSIFLLFYFPGTEALRELGVDRHVAAMGLAPILLPPAFYAGRLLSKQLWPDLVEKADANAAKRLGQ